MWETDSASDVSGGEGGAGESKEPMGDASSAPTKPRIKQEKKKQVSLLMFAKKKQ